MKNHANLIIAITLFLNCQVVPAQESLPTTQKEVTQVTAQDYCNFLNEVAADDPYYLYNEAMDSDEGTACIVRLGEPGSYEYFVISGKENAPIYYINWFDEARYCNWLQNKLQGTDSYLGKNETEDGAYTLNGINENNDFIISKNPNAIYWIADDQENDGGFLNSDTKGFKIESMSTPTLSLMQSSPTDQPSTKSYLKNGVEIVGIMGVATFCSELMMWNRGVRTGPAETTELENNNSRSVLRLRLPTGSATVQRLPHEVAPTSEDFYHQADDLSHKAQESLSKRQTLRWNIKRKEQLLQEAQDNLEKELAEFNSKNLEKTTLGKTAHNLNTISDSTSEILGPYGNPLGLAKTVAVAADVANRKMESAAMKAAKRDLERAQKNLEAARQELHDYEGISARLQLQTKTAEDDARKREEQHILDQAQSGSVNAATWMQHIQDSDRCLQSLHENNEKTLQAFEESLRIAEQAAITVRGEANTAQTRYDIAEQLKADAEMVWEDAQREYDHLEDHIKSLKANENLKAELDLIKDQLKIKQSEATMAYQTFQEAQNEYEAATVNLTKSGKSLEEIALAVEEEFRQKFKEHSAEEDGILRNIERAQFVANVYRKAYITVWPEEAVNNRITEINFESKKQPAGKMESVKESKELSNVTQQESSEKDDIVAVGEDSQSQKKKAKPSTQKIMTSLEKKAQNEKESSILASVATDLMQEKEQMLNFIDNRQLGEKPETAISRTTDSKLMGRAYDGVKIREAASATQKMEAESNESLERYYALRDGKEAQNETKPEKPVTGNVTHDELKEDIRNDWTTIQEVHLVSKVEDEACALLRELGIDGFEDSENED